MKNSVENSHVDRRLANTFNCAEHTALVTIFLDEGCVFSILTSTLESTALLCPHCVRPHCLFHRRPLLFPFAVIVHIVIPKQRLVAVPPRKGLVPDVQIFVLRSLLRRGTVLLMFPVLVPKDVRVGSGDEEGRDGNEDGEFTPQRCFGSACQRPTQKGGRQSGKQRKTRQYLTTAQRDALPRHVRG